MSEDFFIEGKDGTLGTFSVEPSPFMVIEKEIILNLTGNPLAAFIWVYIKSFSNETIFTKGEIMEHFEIDEDTYRKCMEFLAERNLINKKI